MTRTTLNPVLTATPVPSAVTVIRMPQPRPGRSGCPKCAGSGMVHLQHPLKPLGVCIASAPCDCVEGA